MHQGVDMRFISYIHLKRENRSYNIIYTCVVYLEILYVSYSMSITIYIELLLLFPQLRSFEKQQRSLLHGIGLARNPSINSKPYLYNIG